MSPSSTAWKGWVAKADQIRIQIDLPGRAVPLSRRWIHPLLEVSRREIVAFLEETGQPYRLDATNEMLILPTTEEVILTADASGRVEIDIRVRVDVEQMDHRRAAEVLEVPLAKVFSVSTFYKAFSLEPQGDTIIKVCMGTACHVRGGDIILENFERKLGISEGETTEDREYSLERVACVGCCALAPVALVGETVLGNMAPSKVEGTILRLQIEKEKAEREKEHHELDP